MPEQRQVQMLLRVIAANLLRCWKSLSPDIFNASCHFTVIVNVRSPEITWCISTDHSPAVD
jgi:hypothetical protein